MIEHAAKLNSIKLESTINLCGHTKEQWVVLVDCSSLSSTLPKMKMWLPCTCATSLVCRDPDFVAGWGQRSGKSETIYENFLKVEGRQIKHPFVQLNMHLHFLRPPLFGAQMLQTQEIISERKYIFIYPQGHTTLRRGSGKIKCREHNGKINTHSWFHRKQKVKEYFWKRLGNESVPFYGSARNEWVKNSICTTQKNANLVLAI